MRFLTDQDVYAVTTSISAQLGHDVMTAAELGLSRAIDSELLRRARADRRIVVTRDRDSGRLGVRRQNMGRRYHLPEDDASHRRRRAPGTESRTHIRTRKMAASRLIPGDRDQCGSMVAQHASAPSVGTGRRLLAAMLADGRDRRFVDPARFLKLSREADRGDVVIFVHPLLFSVAHHRPVALRNVARRWGRHRRATTAGRACRSLAERHRRVKQRRVSAESVGVDRGAGVHVGAAIDQPLRMSSS